MEKITLGVLDQSHVRRNGTAAEALQESGKLAQYVEQLGYTRFWVSEHHNFKGIAGTSPEVLIPWLASQTKTIKVGSGGIMLPNHSSLKVAENFGILSSLFPGRVDLGIGRAPGTDRLTSHVLNPSNTFSEKEFYHQLLELQAYIYHDEVQDSVHEKVKAFPKAEIPPDFWILTSSGGSAQFAAAFGMSLALAYFISPEGGEDIVEFYKHNFKPSEYQLKPKVIVAIFAFCSENQSEIDDWITEFDYRLLHIESGATGGLPSVEEIRKFPYSIQHLARINANKGRYIVGKPNEVADKIRKLAHKTEADEIMIATITDDFMARKKSYELIAEQLL